MNSRNCHEKHIVVSQTRLGLNAELLYQVPVWGGSSVHSKNSARTQQQVFVPPSSAALLCTWGESKGFDKGKHKG